MFRKLPKRGEWIWYWAEDPAFDTASPDWHYSAWQDTGDEKHLPRKAGAEPVRFTLRDLSRATYDRIGDLSEGHNSVARRVVAYSIVSIVPLVVDGEQRPLDVTRDGSGDPFVCDDDMDMIRAVGTHQDLYTAILTEINRRRSGSPPS